MTKHSMLAIVIGVIIVLGVAAAILYSNIQKTPEQPNITATKAEVTPEKGMTTSSIVDLLKNPENVKCSFTSTTELGDTSGTVYVSGENMRGDFELTTKEGAQVSHIIKNEDTFYMWGDSLKTGLKMAMNINEWAKNAQKVQPTGAASFDPNTPVDFKCAGWTVDSSLFNTPKEIKFISFEGMISPTGTTNEKADTEPTTESK
jgi:hypothetical protein